MSDEPRRWVPAQNSTGTWRTIMVVPHTIDDEGNVLEFRVWGDGTPHESGHGMVWNAETLRRYYKPEDE